MDKAADRVVVVARVRPLNASEEASAEKNPVALRVLSEEGAVKLVDTDYGETYNFDAAFGPETTQARVFSCVGAPLVKSAMEGFNATCLAYGQTSSGKTYTMMGGSEPSTMGIAPLVLHELFHQMSVSPEGTEFLVSVSFVEIYLEKVRDLLDTTRTNLAIRERPDKSIFIEGVSSRYPADAEEALSIMRAGQSNRATAGTDMNLHSSRSHSVFMLHVTRREAGGGVVKTSVLNLVDLAGSEMVKKSGVQKGQRMDEAVAINVSLSALGNVISALTDEKAAHVPYRDSKLTRLLQESLGGNAKTFLVVNLSPSKWNVAESVSSLRFGARAKLVQTRARVNKTRGSEELERLLRQAEAVIEKQAAQIARLKEALAGRRPVGGEEEEEEDSMTRESMPSPALNPTSASPGELEDEEDEKVSEDDEKVSEDEGAAQEDLPAPALPSADAAVPREEEAPPSSPARLLEEARAREQEGTRREIELRLELERMTFSNERLARTVSALEQRREQDEARAGRERAEAESKLREQEERLRERDAEVERLLRSVVPSADAATTKPTGTSQSPLETDDMPSLYDPREEEEEEEEDRRKKTSALAPAASTLKPLTTSSTDSSSSSNVSNNNNNNNNAARFEQLVVMHRVVLQRHAKLESTLRALKHEAHETKRELLKAKGTIEVLRNDLDIARAVSAAKEEFASLQIEDLKAQTRLFAAPTLPKARLVRVVQGHGATSASHPHHG